MKKEDKSMWKQKLCSRKLWAAIISFFVATGMAFFEDFLTEESVSLIISGCASLCAYIVGEGIVDAVRVNKK